ncbi:MAG: serine acetyltransferase [Paludibacteraceae bacterium]|nr:serine acetyltransferase [Paludibacteraceae bacterium]
MAEDNKVKAYPIEKKGDSRQVKFIRKYTTLFIKKRYKRARIGYLINRLLYSCDIYPSVKIGKHFHLMHFGLGVVIHPYTVIGDDVWIYQNVTVGVKHHADYFKFQIGNNVLIGAGAVILGKGEMSIGDNSIIAANSVVLNSVPANAVVAGNPAKIVKLDGNKVDINL